MIDQMADNIQNHHDKGEKPIVELSWREYKRDKLSIIAYSSVTTITFVFGEIFFIAVFFSAGWDTGASLILTVFFSIILLAFFITGISQMIYYRYYRRPKITATGVFKAYPDVNTSNLFFLALNIPMKPLKYFRSINDVVKVEFYYYLKWPKYFLLNFIDGATERFDLDTADIIPLAETDSLTIEKFFKSLKIPVKYITLKTKETSP